MRVMAHSAARIVAMDPFKCRIWNRHDRGANAIDADSCRAEIESVRRHGQLIPVLGRPLAGDAAYEVELAYGARRLFVARHLRIALQVELRGFTDREGLIALDIENRQRCDISPYERGLGFKRWLAAGHFDSQEQMARALNISPAQVSRLVQLARLPAVIVNAFRSPTEICESWGPKLIGALDDPARRAATIRAARMLAGNSPRLRAREVLPRLLAASERGRKLKTELRDRVVGASDGSALFRVRYLSDAVALVFREDHISEQTLVRIEDALASVMRRARLRGRTRTAVPAGPALFTRYQPLLFTAVQRDV
jgi:ParB family chromosome partitioning protein